MYNLHKITLGVVGNPVCHSRSPQIHHFFARELGQCIDYRRIYAKKTHFETVVRHFFDNGGVGLNITLPFKGKAAMFASELSDRAKLVGVVNTLKKTCGGIYGDTTDGQGFIDDVKRLSSSLLVFQGTVVIFGAGGAVRGLLPDVLLQDPPRIVILNRTRSRALGLIDELESWRDHLGFSTELVGGGYELDIAQFDISLLVQGASGFFDIDWRGDLSHTFCYDLNYGERAADFCCWAQAQGATQVHDGLGMLVGQAAASFLLWTGESPDIAATIHYLKRSNPWLEDWWQPPFVQVDFLHIAEAVATRLQEKEAFFEQRLVDIEQGLLPLNGDSFVRFYEEVNDKLVRVWSILVHLNNVLSSAKLRKIHNKLLLDISNHYIREQHNLLFQSTLEKLLVSSAAKTFTRTQKKWCANIKQNFALAGSYLESKNKLVFAQLERELIELSSQFSNVVLDATEAWFLDVAEIELTGVPAQEVQASKILFRNTHPRGVDNFCRLTLKKPFYAAVMSYCENRDIRQKMYRAKATIASDQGSHASLYNTSEIIDKTLLKRHEKATLLGFDDYAAFSLASAAASAEQVTQRLEGLADRYQLKADIEYKELQLFAAQTLQIDEFQPWDIAFVSEKQKRSLFGLDVCLIRHYFPTKNVLQGMLLYVERFFDVRCRFDYSVPTYHKDVQFVEVSNTKGMIGGLYIDLYARDHKQPGAWVDLCRQRYTAADGMICYPIVNLVCNVAPPVGDKPSLMSHEDVEVFFHEVGHCLRSLLTGGEMAILSESHEVERGASSQLLAGWCFQEEVLRDLSAHYVTGEQLPASELAKVIAAKDFHSGLKMIDMVQQSLFDLKVHSSTSFESSSKGSYLGVMQQIRAKIGVVPMPGWDRVANSLIHVFAGGYAASYYDYMWFEVYTADLFRKFKQVDIFDHELAAQLSKE